MTIERFDPPAAAPALINPATDSWTAVLTAVVDLAQNIAGTDFVPKDMKGNVPKVVAAILHSRELGLPPMTGLAGSHVINGRPGISAELMRSLITQAGHDLRITEMTAARCVIRGRRSSWSDDDWTTCSYTMQEAIATGDAKRNQNYSSRPADMLLARATTRIARMVFADVIHGMRSTEELVDMSPEGEGFVQVEQATTPVSRQLPRGGEQQLAVESGSPTAPSIAQEAPVTAGAAVEVGKPPAAPARPGTRRRPPLGKARTAPPAAPRPEESAAAEEDLVEALKESVVAAKATREPVTSIADARAAARQSTITKAQMHWERLLGKPVDREERLWWTGVIIGRPVESTNDLTGDELRTLLGRLEKLRDRAGVEALGTVPEGGE